MGRLLVHICCAPDAIYFLKRLREDFPDRELVGFFYDPNIHPYEEYKLRFIETERVCKELGIKLYEGEYDPERWMKNVKGYEDEPERGERCEICFDFRLERSAKFAKEIGCEEMTTTLLMSPKKRIDQLSASGERTARRHGIKFLTLDYRKGGGTQEMFRLSKDMEIYKQDYCGCIYGLFKQKEDLIGDLSAEPFRRPGSKAERIFFKELRLAVEGLGLPVKEEEFPFLGWRLLRGGMWLDGEPVPSFIIPFSASIRGRVRLRVEDKRDNTFFMNKQGVRIVLRDPILDQPLSEVRGSVNPSFVVDASLAEGIENGKVEVFLETRFETMTSEVMVIGSQDVERLIGIPADALQDGRAVKLEDVVTTLEYFRDEIKAGKMTFVILGAYSVGRPSLSFLNERFGLSPSLIFGYSFAFPTPELVNPINKER